MMRIATVIVLGIAALGLGFSASAEDAKEEKLTGTITCAKCDLKLEKKCATVIKVTKDKVDTIYYFDKAGDKKYHGDYCSASKEGTVTGTVAKMGKKMIVTVKSLEAK